MKNCRIQIETQTEGERTLFSAMGILARSDDRLSIRYEQAGETVFLRVQKHALEMERPSLTLKLIPKRQTEAVLRFGEREGIIPVFTEFLEREIIENGFRLILGYELRFPNAPQVFRLNVLIETISEER